MNFNFNRLPPFKWFVLQNFPFIEADFDSITYYQLLCKLAEEINKVINSNNSIGQQTENLTNAFNELQNYVEHYFDNLDIQTEINNKLDEMAESGQLTDIIAQYLQLAGVLAFDVVDDMKNAENLTNGSIVRTLGYSNIQDTNGSYYKIRNVLNTDVIDDINIIALTNFDNLVAEKIKEKQGMKNYMPTYLELQDYYFTISYNNGHAFLYISLDSINWKKVFKIPDVAFMEDCHAPFDFSCIVDNGYFYLTYDYINRNYNGWNELDENLFRGGNRVGIARTKDFINWEKWNLDIDTQYVQTFAPEFFIDSDNKHYITISLSTTQIKTENNVSRYYKKNYIIETDSNFHNIISTTNNLPVDYVNIDGFIYKEDNTYYLIVKEEQTLSIKIYSSSNIMNFTNLVSEITMYDKSGNVMGIEAPSMIKIDEFYILFVDTYVPTHTTGIFVSTDLIHWSNWNLLNTPDSMYHFTPVLTNNESKNLLNIGYELLNYPPITIDNNMNGMLNEYDLNHYPYTSFVPLPNSTYIFYNSGSQEITLTPLNIFNRNLKNKDFKIVNGNGITTDRDIIVATANQNVRISPQNAQIFGFNWGWASSYVYGANLNPLAFNITAGENITIDYQKCTRIGKIVNLIVSFTPTATIAEFAEMFSNVPKVSNSLLFPISERWNTNEAVKFAYVQDSGGIQAQREFTANKNYRFNLTYICS